VYVCYPVVSITLCPVLAAEDQNRNAVPHYGILKEKRKIDEDIVPIA
jgi:hypothetical protein